MPVRCRLLSFGVPRNEHEALEIENSGFCRICVQVKLLLSFHLCIFKEISQIQSYLQTIDLRPTV